MNTISLENETLDKSADSYNIGVTPLAVSILVSGVPRPLYYSVSFQQTETGQNQINIGSQVFVPLGNRMAKGFVIERLSLSTALSRVESAVRQTPKKQARSLPTTSQLSFIDADVVPDSLDLKPVLSHSPAFLPEQLPLFEWMAHYYGADLFDVLDTAIPARSDAKARPGPLVNNVAFTALTPQALSPAQSNALCGIREALSSPGFSTTLLFGVTGSGKTEVYLRAIEEAVALGGSALVIVPEIALTPQFLDQFQSRLNLPLGLLHSQVGVSERWRAWEAMLRGDLKVAIGARSAVFAPLKELRLIIVDEEHENSYKQSDSLRYHARDVAIMRAKLSECCVILGSATPSFESLFNATRHRYQLAELPDRVTARPIPTLEIVDLRKVKKVEMPSPNISPQLHGAIQSALENKGQVIIFYNRRGFSSYLQCDSCSEVVSCPNCSVTLTYHKRKNRLLCHYCNLSLPAPEVCRFCRDPRTTRVDPESETDKKLAKAAAQVGILSHRGGGTERVVDELIELFPGKTVIRMDRDTVTKKGAYRKILTEMRTGQADILVGTQMIAKGHDLPGVTLVGIIDADVGLHLPDFRASEKAYQLITQAAGRAGRGSVAGRVIVQTREPNHPTIVATVTNRFKAFARFELDLRKKLGYPPWGRLLRLIISSTDRAEAARGAEAVENVLRQIVRSEARDRAPAPGNPIPDTGHPEPETGNQSPDTGSRTFILGPAVAPLEKISNRYRLHFLVKSPSAKTISYIARELNAWKKTLKGYRELRVAIDVDPVDML